MSEYKRWVSYIYHYENNIKKNNIGYARVETRGPKTKITIHINVLSVTDPMDTYLFVRDGGKLEALLVGRVIMDKGVGQGVFTLNTQAINDTRHGMSDIGGLIIGKDRSKFFASEWDEGEIDYDRITSKAGEQEKVDTEVIEEVTEQELLEEDLIEDKPIIEDKPVFEAKPVLEEVSNDKLEEVAEGDDSEVNSEEDKDLNSKIEQAAEQMMEQFPQMYPFEDDEMMSCVRIEPQDIGKLPIDTWILANNSFLLHGYYSYRHIVLMKTADVRSEERRVGKEC